MSTDYKNFQLQLKFKLRYLLHSFRCKALKKKTKFHEMTVIKNFFDRINLWKFNQKENVFVDVGAQIGAWTHPYATQGWQIFGFEASPFNFQLYSKKYQHYKNVHPINKAVSDEHGKIVTFYYSEKFIGLNSLKLNHKCLKGEKTAEIETIRLDSYLRNRTPHVDLVKIDIEGADFLALRSFDIKAMQPKVIILEYGNRSKSFEYKPQDIFEYMKSFNYQSYASNYLSSKGEPYNHFQNNQERPILVEFGKYSDMKTDLNWGEAIFVRKDFEGEFRKTLRNFEYSS